MNFSSLNESILPLDAAAMEAAERKWNNLAKPVGSLGRLETLLTQIAGLCGSPDIRLDKRGVVVFCADNGVLAQGVAQTPPEITATMAGVIADGKSSVCCMARAMGAEVTAVDMGMFSRVCHDKLLDCRIADGTKDMTKGPAMTRAEAERALETGMELARSRKAAGCDILITGEMGIGNTTTSSAVAASLLKTNVREVTGRGAGLDDAGLMRKIAAIEQAIALNRPDSDDALDVLSKVGGFDMAGMAGLFLGGALYRIPVMIDGYISAVSALVAARLCPAARAAMLPSHVSAEPAGRMVLEALGVEPLVYAGMRLGEGTGAVAALPLYDCALAVYDHLLTFADIGM